MPALTASNRTSAIQNFASAELPDEINIAGPVSSGNTAADVAATKIPLQVVTADTWAGGESLPDVAGWLAGGRLLLTPEGNRSLVYLRVKRLCDIAGALALLVLLAPIMLVTLAVLCVSTRGKPIFCQRRVGHLGRMFPMFKFRTMRLDALQMQAQVKNEKDGPIFKNRRDPRITRVGRILRSFSIDEMPQLFNVLAGHMSLVGPRPPIAAEVAKYRAGQFRRLSVKPGLTCLWQVSGRSEIGFDDWVQMDVWYVENQSLWNDLKLLIRTPLSVLSRRGAY